MIRKKEMKHGLEPRRTIRYIQIKEKGAITRKYNSGILKIVILGHILVLNLGKNSKLKCFSGLQS